VPRSKRTSSVLNDDHDDLPEEANRVTNPDDALAAAEEAEAEAAEAEAQAVAARARARAIRLRREAATAKAAAASAVRPTVEAPLAAEPSEPTVEAPVASATAEPGVESRATELDEPSGEAIAAGSEEVEDYPDEPSKRPRRPGRARRVLKVVAAALVVVASVALLGISAVMYQAHRNADAQRELSAEFTAAARQGAVTLMSMNFNTAKDDVQRIIDNTTGDFHKNFQEQAKDFVTVAQSAKVVIQATVTGVGIQKMTKDTATALVTVTTRVSNMASDKQDPRAWRLSVELARDGGQIKMAKVEFVP
jgi:Mce-associated membrane protein